MSCLDSLKDSVNDQLTRLKKDYEDVKFDNNKLLGNFLRDLFPVLEDMFLTIFGNVANNLISRLLDQATAGIKETLTSIYGGIAIALTAVTEMKLVAFVFMVNNMRDNLAKRMQTLSDIRFFVDQLANLIIKIDQDLSYPDIYQRVKRALYDVQRMLVQLKRIKAGLDEYSYFNMTAYKKARTYLDNAIAELSEDDPELQTIFSRFNSNDPSSFMNGIGDYLGRSIINAAKKQIVIAIAILYYILEIVYRLPLPIERLDLLMPLYSNMNADVTKRIKSRFSFNTHGLKVLNTALEIDKTLITKFKASWWGINQLAKYTLDVLGYIVPAVEAIKTDMENKVSSVERSHNFNSLHLKSVQWAAELEDLRASSVFEALYEAGDKINYSVDNTIMEEIITYLKNHDISYSDAVINDFLKTLAPLAGCMLDHDDMRNSLIYLGDLRVRIDRSLSRDEQLSSELDKVIIIQDHLSEVLVDEYRHLNEAFPGALAKLGLVNSGSVLNIASSLLDPTATVNADYLIEGSVLGYSIGSAIGDCIKSEFKHKPSPPTVPATVSTASFDYRPDAEVKKDIDDGDNIYTKLECQTNVPKNGDPDISRIWGESS